ALDAACKKAGIDGGLNPNIDQDLWDKWIMLGSIASMCSAMRGSVGDMMEAEDGPAIMAEILEECRKVAAAEGHPPSDKVVGAIGGYAGGRLQQSGADVTFLVRPARRAALQRDGLVINSPKGDVTQKVKTVLKGSEGGPYDIVLLTCKGYDLDSAIAAIAPAVGADTTVVPLLNGMRHLDVLDAKFGKAKVVGGLARVGVAMSADGTILHTSPFAAISFGERDGK